MTPSMSNDRRSTPVVGRSPCHRLYGLASSIAVPIGGVGPAAHQPSRGEAEVIEGGFQFLEATRS